MYKRDQEPVYSISIAAHLLKVTPRLLRSYEEAGLICPHRTAGNTRLYSEEDMKQLSVVCYLHQEKEVNLQGIKVILSIISAGSSGNARAKERGGETGEGELWEKIREIAPHFFK
ncbi:MAG: MerR family transcriptional regulator [Bacillota bacterium]